MNKLRLRFGGQYFNDISPILSICPVYSIIILACPVEMILVKCQSKRVTQVDMTWDNLSSSVSWKLVHFEPLITCIYPVKPVSFNVKSKPIGIVQSWVDNSDSVLTVHICFLYSFVNSPVSPVHESAGQKEKLTENFAKMKMERNKGRYRVRKNDSKLPNERWSCCVVILFNVQERNLLENFIV